MFVGDVTVQLLQDWVVKVCTALGVIQNGFGCLAPDVASRTILFLIPNVLGPV